MGTDVTSADLGKSLRTPSITETEIAELIALRGETGRVTNVFLIRLAAHYAKAEAEGVINPARHFAGYLWVQRQAVLTYMRMVRNRGLTQPHPWTAEGDQDS
ncbi:hypothetical protein ACLF6K_17315 [Streptomyces xanthophaeus]|uniref:hypothetical protein n=1 Tax=Streptomyces xanthophaeus TaxID=67385 RepID=UPI00398FE368